MQNRILLIIFSSIFLLITCKKDPPVDPPADPLAAPSGTIKIEATPQVVGDAVAGKEYLINGDYVRSGVPSGIALPLLSSQNRLERTGESAELPYDFNLVNHPNGAQLVVPSCLSCHGQILNGELIIGLGSVEQDYTKDRSEDLTLIDAAIPFLYGENSPEWEAYQPFRRASLALGSNIITSVRGPNLATRTTGILASHRDPETLEWLDTPQFSEPVNSLPSDVPAWWLLKKKNAMFYDGSGRGDFRKFLMGTSTLTIENRLEAEEIFKEFDDIHAYINSLEAPKYPNEIDMEKAAIGEDLFYQTCAKCHGTYGDNETYPNLLVSVDKVGTDPSYVRRNAAETDFINWMNNGWFYTGRSAEAYLEYNDAYIAPPLDGVWATAPYLHNGSVPDLASLLNSPERPTYWKRDFSTRDYDMDKMGWKYESVDAANDTETYDTTVEGFGNQGHYYGDGFTEEERSAVLEYLKTL